MSNIKKGIKEWALALEKDEKLAKKFEGIESASDIVKLAKTEGYEFTEDELMDIKMAIVSGGFGITDVIGLGLKGIGKIIQKLTD